MQQNINNNVNVDSPKVSVVMSVYNANKYLNEAVESILKQTFQDFEFIIVNDASTDDTEKILKQFDDPRINIIKNSRNLGLTKSLNIGIKDAKGKYISRMDADDISLPHRFEKQVDFLEQNPDYALIGSSFYQIDENGNTKSLITVLTDDLLIRDALKKQNQFGHGSVVMRKAALLQVGGYNERFKFAQDYDLWLRFAEAYKVANIEEPLYKWRSIQDSVSDKNFPEQFYYATLAVCEAENRQVQKSASPNITNSSQIKNIVEEKIVWKKTSENMGYLIQELRSWIKHLEKERDDIWKSNNERIEQLEREKNSIWDELQRFAKNWETQKAWIEKLEEERSQLLSEIERLK